MKTIAIRLSSTMLIQMKGIDIISVNNFIVNGHFGKQMLSKFILALIVQPMPLLEMFFIIK